MQLRSLSLCTLWEDCQSDPVQRRMHLHVYSEDHIRASLQRFLHLQVHMSQHSPIPPPPPVPRLLIYSLTHDIYSPSGPNRGQQTLPAL